jgi:hypothetical protein
MYHLFALNMDCGIIDVVVKDDALLNARKECMGIPPAEEYTLSWFKMPVRASTHGDPHYRKA